MRTPPFKLTTVMSSSSVDTKGEETLHQTVTVCEYSETSEVHIDKNMTIAAHVMGAFGEMVAKAKDALAK